MKKEIIAFIAGLAAGIGVVSCIRLDQKITYAILDDGFKRTIIRNGCAGYNPTNGVFEYRGHKQ